jgi:tetratricopeptide (TPR) repeat protein
VNRKGHPTFGLPSSRRDESILAGGKTAKQSPPPEFIPEKPTPAGVAELWRTCRGVVAKNLFRSVVLSLVLLGSILRAEDAPEVQDNDTSPYHQALLDYKAGHFQEALDALNATNGTAPSGQDNKVVILKSRILTELKKYDEGEKLLKAQLTGTASTEIQIALGDLLLRERSFNRAAKYYGLALQAKPDDPDITLKLIYAKIGVSDLVGAGQDASRLTPLDPKNPYDDHASYYFAKAALAQATGKTQEAEDDIQTARTLYGITITNRYLKTYLEVFSAPDKGHASDITPPPLVKPAPTGAKQ